MSEDVETMGAYFGHLTPKERRIICSYLASSHGPRIDPVEVRILPFIPLKEVLETLTRIITCEVCNDRKTVHLYSRLIFLQEKFHGQSNTHNDAVLPEASDAN